MKQNSRAFTPTELPQVRFGNNGSPSMMILDLFERLARARAMKMAYPALLFGEPVNLGSSKRESQIQELFTTDEPEKRVGGSPQRLRRGLISGTYSQMLSQRLPQKRRIFRTTLVAEYKCQKGSVINS
jgi:hypothetical protein